MLRNSQHPMNSEERLVKVSRDRPCLSRAKTMLGLGVFAVAVCMPPTVLPAAEASPESSSQPQRCEWIEGTLIPQVVIGVRRLGDVIDGDDAVDFLDVFADSSGGEPVSRVNLFKPFFVTRDGVGVKRVRIQEGYCDTPLGWVASDRLEFLESRYAYVFAQQEQSGTAELHDRSQEAYERHLAQLKNRDDARTAQTVVLRRRAGAGAWLPQTQQDVVPFIELLQQSRDAARNEPDYPDTTPTFRYGFPAENRLLHMGAICGGPVNVDSLKELKKKVAQNAGLEMLFVIDETSSMKPYFEGVADFLDDVEGLAFGKEQPGQVGVAYYSDGPQKADWFRWSQAIAPAGVKGLALIDPGDAGKLAKEIRANEDKLPPDDFSDAPERSLEALLHAINEAGFTKGANKYVAVIGDTGYEAKSDDSDEAERLKAKLLADLGAQINEKDLTVFFVHVGEQLTKAEKLFKADYEAVKKECLILKIPDERVTYLTAEENTLADKLEQARNTAEALRRRRERDIARMESRNQTTEPGPKLLAWLKPQGMTHEQYNESHLQYYVPTRSWLYEPNAKATGEQNPQFTELLFLSAFERQALISLLKHCRERLAKNLPVDGAAAARAFAETLAETTGHAEAVGDVMVCWDEIPEQQQRIGVFLEDKLGMRIKATLPFPPDGYREQDDDPDAENPHGTHEFWRALLRVEHVLEALKDADDETFWFEAASLVP